MACKPDIVYDPHRQPNGKPVQRVRRPRRRLLHLEFPFFTQSVPYRAKITWRSRVIQFLVGTAVSVLSLGVGTAYADPAPGVTEIDWAPFEAWLHGEIIHLCAGAIALGILIWTVAQFRFRGDR